MNEPLQDQPNNEGAGGKLSISEPGEGVSAAPIPKPKRTTRQFLNKYRQLGLPNAKRMRRRTRLQEAAHKEAVNRTMVRELIRRLGVCLRAFEQLKQEENWAVRGDDVLWVGDDSPLGIVEVAEKELGL